MSCVRTHMVTKHSTRHPHMPLGTTLPSHDCLECPPGGTIGHPGGQQKKFLPFGHGMDLAAFKGTGLQNKSFQDRAEISKA